MDIQTRTGTFSDVIDKTYNQDNQYINNPPRYPCINPKTLYDISVIGIDSYQYIVRINPIGISVPSLSNTTIPIPTK